MSQLLSLPEFRQLLHGRLERLYDQRQAQAALIDPLYGDLLGELRGLILRSGKRLRPYLTYLAYYGFGGRSEAAILDLAASQELLHNFLLIHDDVFDRDVMRYGGLNISGAYRLKLPRQLRPSERHHLADTMALMGGDITLGFGFRQIIESDFPAELRIAALSRIERMIFEVAGGEILDVLIPTFALTDVTEERLLRVCRYKTASYSFEAPLQLGAIMAQASAAQLNAITGFAIPLGVAFQLADDLLGTFGNETELGKSVLTDLREGKRTVLVLKAMDLADAEGRAVLTASLGNRRANYSDLEQVRAVLQDCGARAYVEALAEAQIAQSLLALPAVGFAAEATRELESLVQFSIHRRL